MFDVREAPTARDLRREDAQRRLEALGKRTLQQVEPVGLQPGVGQVSRVEAEHGTRGSEIEQPTQLTLQALREMAGALQVVHGAAMRSGVAQSPEFRARTGAVQQSLSRATQLLRSGALRDHAQAGQTVAVLHQLSSEISQLPAVDAAVASSAPAARPVVPATTLSLGLSDAEGGALPPEPDRVGAVQFDRDGAEHEDPAEVRQLAVAGTSGGGAELPHLAQIQKSFGHHDVTGVRAHIGGAAAAATSALGARGYAYGDAVAFATEPDLRLAAHEGAHVVQQRGGVRLAGGVGRAGDEYERHADAVADLVVRGESAQPLLDQLAHRGAAGGPAVQRDLAEDRVWLESLRHDEASGDYTHADGTALSTAEQRRLRGVLRRISGGAARSAPTDRPSAVDAHERLESEYSGTTFEPTELDASREARLGTGMHRSDEGAPTGRVGDSASGGRRRRLGRAADGTRAVIETSDETRRRALPDHTTVERHEVGRRARRIGPARAAVDIHDELVRRDEALAAQLAATTNSAERASIAAARRGLSRDIEALAVPDVSAADASRIADAHGLRDVIEEDVTATTTATDPNPLDGTVGTATETRRDIHDTDGSGAREIERRSTTLDLGAGSYEAHHDEEVASLEANGTTRRELSSSGERLEVGDGRVAGSRVSRRESEDRFADGSTERTATERTTSGAAIITEDETGARVGRTVRREREVGGTTLTGEAAGALEVTDRRIGASGSATGSVRRGAYTGSARASTDGSFAIDITPLDDGSGQFRLTFTIHVGVLGALTGGVSDSEGGSASIAVRGSARGDLVTSRVIDETEVQRYTAAADRADRGETVSEPPEFGRLARLRVAGENADALLTAGAVFGNGDTAAAMANGESVMLDAEVGVGATASLSASGTASTMGGAMSLGGSGEVSGDERWRRTVQVERITVGGAPRIRITVSYRNETERAATGSVTVGDGAVRGRVADEAGATDSTQFVINPTAADYAARYQAIVGTTNREDLRALEHQYREDVRLSRHIDDDATETEGEVGPTSAVMIGSRTRRHHRDDTTTVMDAAGTPVAIEGAVAGGTEADVRLRAGGHDIDLGGYSEGVSGRYDRDAGLSVDISAAEESIDPLAAISDASRALSEADARGRVALVAAHTPTEHLLNALQQFSHTWGYHLSEADVEEIGRRAHNRPNWFACCIVADADVLDAWRTLRASLMNPRPDATEARIDQVAAINLAHLRALATWMEHANRHGMECIERVLRRWGETTSHEVDAANLGSGFEWPVSLRDTHSRYDELATQARAIRGRFETALARPDGTTEAQAQFNSVREGLERVLSEVRACTDFRSEARRSEMIREIEHIRADLYVHHRDFERRWAELHNSCGGEPVTADEIRATRASGAETAAERARAYVRAEIRVLQGNHRRETEMLQQVQALSRDRSARHVAEAASICTQVHNLHRTWIQQIVDLRQAYDQAGTPPAAWQISIGPGERRNRELEPNVGWLIIEYSRVMSDSIDANWGDRVNQWRQQGADY
ncbi:MAG TPA: DUF4157 domain-containing protein [Kofleriaceae bacterium]|nr:DUF4157 domain-containing protein [Kofleriaceae bacterium]